MTLLHVNIEPTNKCQLNCKYCGDRREREEGYITLGNFKKILDMLPHPVEIRLFLSGEPLLHSYISLLVLSALNNGHIVLIHTNGVDLDKHTELFVVGELYPKKMTIKVSTIDGKISKRLEKKIIDFQEGNKKHGSPINFSIYNIGKPPKLMKYPIYIENRTPHNWIDKNSIRGAEEREFKIPCGFLEDSLAIYWNGDTPVCCADLNGDTIIGNIFKDGIDYILNRLKAFKVLQEKNLKCYPCNNCERYGE